MKKNIEFVINKNHPIIKGHTVHGQTVLPGLAYIDMLYQLANQAIGIDYRTHSLKNLSIFNPLVLIDDLAVKINVSFVKESNYWKISVSDDEVKNLDNVFSKSSYITAELHKEEIKYHKKINLAGIKKGSRKAIDIEKIYEGARSQGLIHHGMSKANGYVYLNKSNCIIDVGIAEIYKNKTRNILFHPTLIDGAAMASGAMHYLESALEVAEKQSAIDIPNIDDEALYLPLHYESFSCVEPLLTHCYAVVNYSSIKMVNDIRKTDIEFFNEAGKQVGQLVGITAKKVRYKEQISPLSKRQKSSSILEQVHKSSDISSECAASRASETNIASSQFSNTQPQLQKIFSKVLHVPISQIEVEVAFFELGLESSQLLGVVHDIEDEFNLSLSPTLLFEYSNIRELAEYLENKMGEMETLNSSEGARLQNDYFRATLDGAKEAHELAVLNSFVFYEYEAYLQDHLVYEKPALMGITHPCLVVESYIQNHPNAYPIMLKNVEFIGGPVILEKDKSVTVEVCIDASGDLAHFETVHYVTDPGSKKSCCRGELLEAVTERGEEFDIHGLLSKSRLLSEEDLDKANHGVKDFIIGVSLRVIDSVYIYDENTSISRVCLSDNLRTHDGGGHYVFDPLLLNACYFFNPTGSNKQAENLWIPLIIEGLTVFRKMTKTVYVVNKIRALKPGFMAFDAMFLTESGECIAKVKNASIKEVLDPSRLENASFRDFVSKSQASVIPSVANIKRMGESLDIAIIGMAGRYPESYDMKAFWENLRVGKDCVKEIPKERWDWQEYYSEDRSKPGYVYSKWGGFIQDMDRFDPLFFNISPREAEIMDPQERVFLEHCWMAMEDAGYTRESLRLDNGDSGQIGVYVGVMSAEYSLYAAEASLQGRRFGMGGGNSSIATRVSYFCDFQGPSMAIDTMCSSSLTALYLACGGLKEKRIDAALAGGVNLSLHPNKYLMLSQGQFISSKGHCESFGEGGDGYIPGEGVGVLLLKRLLDAESHKDHIYGVIKNSSINHGGKTSGYTVPNPHAQADVIRRAYEESGIDPRTVSYIEAHGTGTSLGDPIEIAGLSKAFEGDTKDKQYCAIGSAKSNIGHCESAAGIAGVTKVLLQMKYGQLVPSLHSEVLNPHIDFANSPFVVQQALAPWKRPVLTIDGEKKEYPRIAGVSSFGAGGSNAHVVIEEYIEQEKPRREESKRLGKPVIIVLSAKDSDRLKESVERLLEMIREGGYAESELLDIGYSLQVGREAMEERLAMLVRTSKELEEKLQAYLLGGEEDDGDCYRGQVKRNKEALSVFEADEDMAIAIRAWISKGKYGKLLDLWVKGLVVDWSKLYGEEKPRRISLPTYPFARERYWIPEMEEGSLAVSQLSKEEIPVSSSRAPSQKVILVKDWERKDIVSVEKEEVEAGVVVILATEATRKLGLALFKQLPSIEVVLLVHGSQDSSTGIATDFYSASSGKALYQQIKAKQNFCLLLGFIDISAYDAEYENSTELESGKIVLLQELINHERDKAFKLLHISHKLQNFLLPKTTMQGARLAGLYRMLAAEYKQIESLTVDSDLPLRSHNKLATQIQLEFLYGAKGEGDTELCYREGKRHVSLLKESSVVSESVLKEKTYKPDDVILITGGSRGLGAAVAAHVVSQGVKQLVIMGREALPDFTQWKATIGNAERIEDVEKIKRLQSFIDQGVSVRYYNVALTEEEKLREIVTAIREELGAITGVIHCAGLLGQNPAFYKKQIEEFEAVYEPKVKGLMSLHRVLTQEPLEFFMLFSSVSSVVPVLSVGQSDYAMANAFLDYYAQYQAGQGCGYFRAIQWPVWGEVGMGMAQAPSSIYTHTGLTPLSTADGLAFLDRIQGGADTVCLPCVVETSKAGYGELLQLRSISQPQEKSHVLELSSSDLRLAIQHWLQNMFMAELRLSLDQLDADKPFDEYGTDSIVIAQLGSVMQEKISEPLSPSLLLEHSTLAALTEYFVVNHGNVLQDELLGEVSRGTEGGNGVSPESIESDGLPLSKEFSMQGNAKGTGAVSSNELGVSAEDIAVVGMSCRFPGGATHEAYWDSLSQGVSAIKPVPNGRWDNTGGRVDYGGWVDGIDLFDAKFFRINEDDAGIMDPQARVILEESLRAIYDAGYDHQALSGEKVGVYIGGRAQPSMNMGALFQASNPILGVGQNYLATNISRFFNLGGPSLVVDTACSSGLTGMSIATDGLIGRRIDMAFVGAVSLLTTPHTHELFDLRNILNNSGEFHVFDKRSSGEVLGEGAGVVILKRLADAIRDGNQIYSVIKAISMNNDGRTLGPGSPNLEAQKQVMQEALTRSGKQAHEIGYIEANGAGSAIVDTLEIKALSAVYQLDNQAMESCYIGSIKPNVGHLLLSSGMAGFIRCVLSLHHQHIPPFLSALEPFDYYDFAASRINFNRDFIPWELGSGGKRVAALNSFPDGGTNCHIILEEFIPDDKYHQHYRTKPSPALARKHIPLQPIPLRNNDQLTGADNNSSDNKEKNTEIAQELAGVYARNLDKGFKQITNSNLWGKYYEKEL